MKSYYDRRATTQPEIEIGDLVMSNAKKIQSKLATRKFTPRLYGPFKVLEKGGNRVFNLDIPACCQFHPVFDVFLLEPYKVSNRPNREQPLQEPEDVEGDLECEIERIVKSERIIYTRKVRRVNNEFEELQYFVKWAECSEDENRGEPPEGLANAREERKIFHREKPEMQGPNLAA